MIISTVTCGNDGWSLVVVCQKCASSVTLLPPVEMPLKPGQSRRSNRITSNWISKFQDQQHCALTKFRSTTASCGCRSAIRGSPSASVAQSVAMPNARSATQLEAEELTERRVKPGWINPNTTGGNFFSWCCSGLDQFEMVGSTHGSKIAAAIRGDNELYSVWH